MSLSSVGRMLISSSEGPCTNLGGCNLRLALKQASKCVSHTEENIFHMSLSLVGRALNSSSDGPGSNLGGFNPRLALMQAAKCWSHTKEYIFHMSLAQLLERWTRVQMVRVQTSVCSILDWLWRKRPSVGLILKYIVVISHLAQLVERWFRVQMVRVQTSAGSDASGQVLVSYQRLYFSYIT
jgi:hypothetical protein